MQKPTLQGWKTIIGSVGMAIVAVLWSLAIIDDNTALALGGLLGGLTGVAMKLGHNRVETKVDAIEQTLTKLVGGAQQAPPQE